MSENNINPVRNTKALSEKDKISNGINPVRSKSLEATDAPLVQTSNGVKAAIEAMLFASEKPLTLEQIKDALDNIGAHEIRKTIEELRVEYEKTNRGIRIVEIAGGFQMITAPVFVSFLKKLYKKQHVEKLSLPALETLAIVAYKQPVTRLKIEAIRNVNVDGLIKGLLDKALIRVVGRRKAPGRPKVYGTTRQFLEHFGLRSLEELPKIEESLASRPQGDKADDNSASVEKELSQTQDSPVLSATKEETNEPKKSAKDS